MGPVRIKYYGLLPMTRRTYLVLQFVLFLVWVALMVVGLSVMLRMQVMFPRPPDMKVEDDLLYQTLLALFWIGLVFVIAEGIETMVMLRKFARAEAAQKARSLDLTTGESAPSLPSSIAVQLPPNERPNTNIQP